MYFSIHENVLFFNMNTILVFSLFISAKHVDFTFNDLKMYLTDRDTNSPVTDCERHVTDDDDPQRSDGHCGVSSHSDVTP